MHLEFGECLRAILQQRHCSILQLQRKLGLKSATSISRILRDECSYSVTKNFFDQLRFTDALALHKGELQQLEEALEVKRLGRDVWEAYRKLERLLFSPDDEEDETLSIKLISQDGESVIPLREWIDELASCESVQGLVFNHCYPPFFCALLRLFQLLPKGAFSLKHYFDISTSPQSVIDPFISLISALRFDHYEGLYKIVSEENIHNFPSSRRNKAYLWATLADGVRVIYTIVMTEDQRLFMCRAPGGDALWNMQTELLRTDDFKGYIRVRRDRTDNHARADLVSLSRRLLFMEKDRTQRILRKNLCISFVPPQSLLRMALSVPAFASDEYKEALAALTGIHTERHNLIYTKKQSTQIVLDKEAMRIFAREGFLKDHPRGFPPVLRATRVKMLEELIRQCKTNPFFHVYMGAHDFPYRELDYISFSNLGIYVYDAEADYGLDKPLYEALITIDELSKLFDGFFDNVILAKHVDSEAQSIAFLSSLLDGLKGGG